MNNDNEKDLLNAEAAESADEVLVEAEATDADVAAEPEAKEVPEEIADTAVDAEQEEAPASEDVSEECVSEEEFSLSHTPTGDYGPLSHVSTEATAKKRSIVTPIIIAAAAFLLVAALVFGGVFVYKAFFGTSLKGVWVEKGYEDQGIYFEFDDDGNAYLRGGGINYYGTYETKTVDMEKDTEIPEIVKTLSEAENLTGKVNVFKSDFYMFGMYGGELIYTVGTVDGEKSVEFMFSDGNGGAAKITLVKAKLPEINMDPTVITNASADEAGLKTLEIDKNILGTWNEADYGTYTFYEDGTANYKTNYQIDQSYSMFYGITMGYGVDLDFKYTVKDGSIYMTVDYFTGESNDGVMSYYLDGKNLVIDGVGYAKVEK